MTTRTANIIRTTNETSIDLQLNIDGSGVANVDCAVRFLSHMLEQLALNARFDLTLTASGDIDIDDHHVVEDIAISLGRALADALGDKVGSTRYGHVILPMDEVVTTVACDLSGRFSYRFDASFEYAKVGDMSAQMVKHFWGSFAQNAKINLYVKSEFGDNDHHIAEGIFKACGRALRMACELDSRLSQQLPSTKGFL